MSVLLDRLQTKHQAPSNTDFGVTLWVLMLNIQCIILEIGEGHNREKAVDDQQDIVTVFMSSFLTKAVAYMCQ